jgi:hypothetical protein
MKTMLCTIAALSLGLGARVLTAQEAEPGVQTSTAAAPVPSKAHTQAPAQAPPAQAGAAAANSPGAKPKAAPPTAAAATASGAAKGKSSDRIELDTTQISGNRELPKVMYVVPWRRADPGDFSGKPPNSLLDEALTPVDRDVFRRQNRYYSAVQDQTQSAKSQAGAASGGSDGSTHKDEK